MDLTPKLMSTAGKFLNTNKSPIKRTGAPEKNGDSKARTSKVCTEPSTFVIPQRRSPKNEQLSKSQHAGASSSQVQEKKHKNADSGPKVIL